MEKSQQRAGIDAGDFNKINSSTSTTSQMSRRTIRHKTPEAKWQDKHSITSHTKVENSSGSSQLDPFPYLSKPSSSSFRSSSRSKSRERSSSRSKSNSLSSAEGNTKRNPKFNRETQNPKAKEDFVKPNINVNEMLANSKLATGVSLTGSGSVAFDSADCISPNEIFFSRSYMPTHKAKPTSPLENYKSKSSSRSSCVKGKTCVLDKSRSITSSASLIRMSTGIRIRSSETSKTSSVGNIGKLSVTESNKCHTNVLLSCIGGGACMAQNHAPIVKKDRPLDVDSLPSMEIVKEIRISWAEKHRPGSLSGFICHKQQAQLVKQLISQGNCPHILFQGPPGSGKKALIMALLREIYGGSAWRVSHELRSFEVKGQRYGTVNLPVASSPHHMELTVLPAGEGARSVLMTLIKELARNSEIAFLEDYESSFAADYKVMVLYEVDRLSKDVQHIIKWMMDRYTDAVKLVLCSENDLNLVDSVKNRCQVIKVDAPVTHEIMEVLLHIAKKERFDLPMKFAARIASKSKQNLRRAIMSLEACKTDQYPFQDDQPIPMGWEEVVMEIATEILTDPTSKRVFLVRAKLQKLLADYVNPKLLLQTLMEELLKKIDTSLKKEFCYCYTYCEKYLLKGNVLIKLEDFVTKVISIYARHLKERATI